MLNLFILIIGSFLVFIFSTLSGGGASLLFMPLIAYTIGVKSVAPVMTLGISLSSGSKIFFFWKHINWKLFKVLIPSTLVGALIGARLFAELSSEYLQIIIGVFLILTIFQFNNKEKDEKKLLKTWHFVPLGFFVSFLSGLIGGVGPLMNSAYLNYGMTKEELLATRSANAIFLHLIKIVSYAYMGFVTFDVIKYGLLLGVVSVGAIYIGKKILHRMSELIFRKIVVSTMVLSGFLMVWRHFETIEGIIQFIKEW
jgi:uncharacterized protein